MKILINLNINGEIIRKEKIISSMIITRSELLTDFEAPPIEELFCWIMCSEQDIWIKCSNDTSFTYLISALSYENNSSIIEVLFSDTNESPNLSKRNSFDMSSVINKDEPFTRDELTEYDTKDLILIPSKRKKGQHYAFFWENIIYHVKSQLNKGEDFFEISYQLNNESIVFNRDIWENILVRRNEHSTDFLSFFTDTFYRTSIYHKKLEEINSNEDIFERLKIFLYDFRTFPDYIGDRLDKLSETFPQYYLSTYYFTEEEIEYILNFPTSNGLVLKDCLDFLIEEKSSDGVMCSSHDVFPIFVKVFSLRKGFDSGYAKFSKKFKGVKKSSNK
jgi:hypothetical protein